MRIKLLRLNQDFTIDESFGEKGYLELNGFAIKIEIVDDKLYVFTNTSRSDVLSHLTIFDNTVYKINLGEGLLTVDDESYKNNLILYPNPTTGFIKINLTDISSDKVDIINNTSMKLFTKEILNGYLDVSDLNKGIYLLKIGQRFYKIVKE